jgi:DUF2934 family protein
MKPATTMPAPSQTIYRTLESIELQEQIRRRAYELYEQRGREDGHDLEDWLRAESEVTERKARAIAA